MKHLCIVLLLFSLTASTYVCAKLVVKPYGYVAYDHWYDTRQVLSAREDFFLLFPLPPQLDEFCEDINAHGKWQMTALQTRMGLTAEMPGWWKDSELKGFIEADFLGSADPFIYNYRLRFAYLAIKTKKWKFLAGQWWHPLFTLDCFPDTICFNNGAPMEPQARAPQVRFTYTTDRYELIVAALSQEMQFESAGPLSFSTEYIRDSVTPNFHIHGRYFPVKDAVLGVAFDFLRLAPRVVTDNDVATHERINSVIAEIYGAYNAKKYQIRAKFTYAQNGTEQLMISGYGVRTRDPVTDVRTYSNTQAIAAWLDMAYWFSHETKSVGLFVGATQNIGATDPLYIDPTTGEPILYQFDPHLARVARIAPRFRYKKFPFQIGLELEWTYAAYGKLNKRAHVEHPRGVNNVRLYFEIMYNF